jgi:hypothetical protein
MAEVNVENIEQAEELFMEKMGFARDTDGLELSDDQLVNFLMLCHQMEYGVGAESEDEEDYDEEEMSEDGMKVKVIKVKGGDMRSIMDEMLGHGGPKIMDQ